MNSWLLLIYQRSIWGNFSKRCIGIWWTMNCWECADPAAGCWGRVANPPVWSEQSCICGLLRAVTSGKVTAAMGLECQHTQMLFVAAAKCKASSRPPLSALRASCKDQPHWVKMHGGVSAEQSHLRQFSLTTALRMQINYLTTESDFQLTTALSQSSTKSRELLYVFEHPPNIVRFIEASLKGNVLLFVSLHWVSKHSKLKIIQGKEKQNKNLTYLRSFNYCINCSWRCCSCSYYKFMRWISLMYFWEAQHECCTRNVLHESRDKQDVTNSGAWTKAHMGPRAPLADPKKQEKMEELKSQGNNTLGQIKRFILSRRNTLVLFCLFKMVIFWDWIEEKFKNKKTFCTETANNLILKMKSSILLKYLEAII